MNPHKTLAGMNCITLDNLNLPNPPKKTPINPVESINMTRMVFSESSPSCEEMSEAIDAKNTAAVMSGPEIDIGN